MLSSLRTPLFAGLLALAFAACGGGNTKPTQHDGGASDGPHVQFDGPHTQQDGSTNPQQDGGSACGTTCASTGGAAAAGLCKCTSDCACNNQCMNPWPTETPAVAGSCWLACTQPTDCQSTEECLGITSSQGACVPKGTLSGTFTGIPSYLSTETPAQGQFGTASVTWAAGDQNVTFGGGIAYQYTSSTSSTTYWIINLFPVTSGTPDITKNLFIQITATDYGVKSWDLSQANTPLVQYEILGLSGQTITSDTIGGLGLTGTLQLTAAGAGAGAAVTGSITGGEAVKFVVELCGPHTSTCQ